MSTNLPDNVSDLLRRLTGGSSGNPETFHPFKVERVAGAAPVTPIAGQWHSWWTYDGGAGWSAGAAPGAVRNPTRATAGALGQSDPGSGRTRLLLTGRGASVGATSGIQNYTVIYDRLLDISGLSGTSTGSQTVGGSLSRYTNGLGVEIWVEIYTQVGANAHTLTISYHNQDNAAKTTTVTLGGTNAREAQRMIKANLAAGDTGVLVVDSVQLDTSTGTAGDFGITLVYPLLSMPIPGLCVMTDCPLLDKIRPLQTGAAIAAMTYSSTATVLGIQCVLAFIDGPVPT